MLNNTKRAKKVVGWAAHLVAKVLQGQPEVKPTHPLARPQPLMVIDHNVYIAARFPVCSESGARIDQEKLLLFSRTLSKARAQRRLRTPYRLQGNQPMRI